MSARWGCEERAQQRQRHLYGSGRRRISCDVRCISLSGFFVGNDFLVFLYPDNHGREESERREKVGGAVAEPLDQTSA
jgi:hypothetical protein